MSKAKMMAAKELIQEKRYDEARKMLKGVDHPTAREWMAKLDAMEPSKKGVSRSIVGLGIAAVVIISALLIVIVVLVSKQSQQPSLVAIIPTAIPTATSTPVPPSSLPPTWTPTSEPTKAPTATSAPSYSSLIVGNWIEAGGGRSYTFYADGTGFSDNIGGSFEFTYTLGGQDTLTVNLGEGYANTWTIRSLTQGTLKFETEYGVQTYHRK